MSKKLKFNQPKKLPLPDDYVSSIKFSPTTDESYNGEIVPSNHKRFVFLVKKAKDCLFSRRNGYRGKIICGYLFVIRLFGFNITKW